MTGEVDIAVVAGVAVFVVVIVVVVVGGVLSRARGYC